MGRSALIVDDSKTSRVVLSRILETHDLDVDMAESAEDALEYLNDSRPDVIFMDHMMPGMDGFQAVEAIKKDPRTATIPIMMYTSQKGEVYVGQARALGAVGVLPKEVEPVEVSKILESLHIIGEPAKHANLAQASNVVGDIPVLEGLDSDMRFMLETLFDQQRAILKRDMQRSSEAIAAQVADQIKAEDNAEIVERPFWATPVSLAWIAVAILGLLGIALALLYQQQESRLQQARDENSAMLATVRRIETSATSSELSMRQQLDAGQSAADSIGSAAFAAIEWGFNRSGQYPFGQEALGDMRLADFEELSRHLEDVNFSGQVFIETHVGEHCLVLAAGGYQLAPPELPATDCDLRGLNYEEGLEMSGRSSVAMADFLLTTEARTAGQIRFVIAPRGTTNPARNYPLSARNVSAGEWNRIADSNNRIQISVLPNP